MTKRLHSNSYIAILAFIFSGGLLFSSCGGASIDNKDMRGNDQSLNLEDLMDSDERTEEKRICTDWEMDLEKSMLSVNGNCRKNNILRLEFDEYLVVEEPNNPNPVILSPIAALKTADSEGFYERVFKVNGKPFSGKLIGYHAGKRIIEANFKKGYRNGVFTVWANTGRVYENTLGTGTDKGEPIHILEQTARKPILYLYPNEEQKINVQLDFEGKLTTTYPKYPQQTGWEVTAQTDGTLQDTEGKEYYALYWEGESDYKYDLSTGFVVAGESSIAFLEEKLATLGLNRREANEFINYWLPELESNPYNLIHFAQKEYTDQAPLFITPQPETTIRVFMVYQRLEKEQTIKEQILISPERKGFTVVEWGGMEQVTQSNLLK
ncbi:MAG: hypothetical protein MK212_15760 [Saprospiraceae bacterium]|nr:hypothetical protein [Saprospiraceae bacterium]